MFVYMLCHVVSGDTMKEQCAIIALGSSTLFLAIDYVAPSYIVPINDIQVNEQCMG
jgi:hypothetical protein